MTDLQFNELKNSIGNVLSAIKARHTLLGIAVLLVIQQSCMETAVRRIVKSELENIPVCTQTGKSS